MKKVQLVWQSAAFLVISLFVNSADAGIAFGEPNEINFNDRSDVVKADGSVKTAGEGIRNGDRFYGIFRANNITTPSGSQNDPVPEVTGVFDVQASFIVSTGGSNAGGAVAAGTILTDFDLATYTGGTIILFSPTNKTGTEGILGTGPITLADGSGITGLGATAGSAMSLFEGGTVVEPLLDGPTQAAGIVAASDGSALGDFGFTSFASPTDWGVAGNGYWAGTATLFGGVSLSANSTFIYGLNAFAGTGSIADTGGGPVPLYNPNIELAAFGIPGLTSIDDLVGSSIYLNDGFDNFGLTPGAFADPSGAHRFHLTGKGNTFGPTTGSPWSLHSSDPAHVFASPEPGSMFLALIGAGCAAPFARRRRRKAAEQTAV